MAINNLSKDEFVAKLGDVVSASRPIRSFQRLKGREEDLFKIEKALTAPGRHVFVYGDRGVGKSSLAATAAYIYQSSDAPPIFVSGSVNDTFKTIISNIVYQALRRTRTETRKSSASLGFEWRGLKLNSSTEVSWPDIANLIHSVGDAAELLKEVQTLYSERSVVLVDEFDTIGDAEERGKFASLLKQLGDQDVSLKFIFTGIGKSLDELLGAHQSAHRQLHTHELPKLPWDGRREIVESAAKEFDISVHNDVIWRISAVCDGYPYYVHLILEYMLWAAFEDDADVDELNWSHYHKGLQAAVESINAELRKPYDHAVVHRDLEFEEVVWSTADHDDLIRGLTSMYESYSIINRRRGALPTLGREQYSAMIRKLKGISYGAILQQEKPRVGLYSYREKMLRGYVRMQAAANGYELTGEREAPKQFMRASSARHGYRQGPSLPRGVRQNVLIREPDPEK